VSYKAVLVVLWACCIAGAAVASESHRLCGLHAHAEQIRLHDELQVIAEETGVLIIAELDVTN